MASTTKRKRGPKDQQSPTPERRYIKKPKLAISSDPLQQINETTFPYLKLPGEIRNAIYAYTLIDYDYSIRFEAGISKIDRRCIVRRLFRARPGPPDRDDLPGQQKGSVSKSYTSYKPVEEFQQTAFGVNLFQTCRQINDEVAAIFYGQNVFVCEAVPHLYAFLEHFQQRLDLVKHIVLCAHDANIIGLNYCGPSHLRHAPLHTIFSLLAHATNLEGLYLNKRIFQKLSRNANLAAFRFFMRDHGWMQAMALQKKNKLAALDILKMPTLSSKTSSKPRWSITKEGQEKFRAELAARMMVK